MSRLDKDKFEAAFAKQEAASGVKAGGEQDPAVQDLWSMLEPALEEKGRYEAEHREHLRETTEDIRSWREARGCAMGFAVFIVVVMLAIIGFVVSGFTKFTFASLGGDGVKIAFVTATFGIVFGLTALLVRGAFTPGKRDDVAMLPEGAKTVIETIQTLMGHHGG